MIILNLEIIHLHVWTFQFFESEVIYESIFVVTLHEMF